MLEYARICSVKILNMFSKLPKMLTIMNVCFLPLTSDPYSLWDLLSIIASP